MPNYVFLLQVITRYVKMNLDHWRVLDMKGIFKYEINRILFMNTNLLPVLMAAAEVFLILHWPIMGGRTQIICVI